MNFKDLKTLVRKGESDQVEFKRSTGQRTAAAKALCSMLNGLGGIVIGLPVGCPKHRGTLPWKEYVDPFHKVPAKYLVVLSMSGFSWDLVEYLDSPKVVARWKDRRQERPTASA